GWRGRTQPSRSYARRPSWRRFCAGCASSRPAGVNVTTRDDVNFEAPFRKPRETAKDSRIAAGGGEVLFLERRFTGQECVMGRLRLLLLLVLFLLPSAAARAGEPFRYPEGEHGKGSLKYINGVAVLVVEGTPAEIGEQVGVLAVKPMARMQVIVKEFIKVRGWEAAYPLLIKAGDGLLQRFPEASREEIEASVKASGLERDLVVFVNTIFEMRSVGGCSTLIVEADRSATHAPLFGRNLDGPPIGGVYEYTLVTVYRQKGKQAFASIGYPGFAGVFSGINAAGLALTMNEINETADKAPRFDPEGTPKFQAFRRVLEECTT